MMKIKDYLFSFFIILGIICIFAGVDYLAHIVNSEYSVPSYYFRNKIIFGTLIGFISYLIFRKKPLFIKSLLVSLSVSVLLQIRYYLEGYPKNFVILFLGIHFIILLPVSYIILKVFKR